MQLRSPNSKVISKAFRKQKEAFGLLAADGQTFVPPMFNASLRWLPVLIPPVPPSCFQQMGSDSDPVPQRDGTLVLFKPVRWVFSV